MVDDVDADFRQTVHVGFAGTKVAALDGVLEKAEDAVAVVAVVLGGVNPSLSCNGVCPAWGVVIGEAVDVIALLTESGGGRRSCQTLRPPR